MKKNLPAILLLALLFGFALGRLGDHGRPVINLLHEIARVFFGMVAIVCKLAPIAAAGAMAFSSVAVVLNALLLRRRVRR